MSFCNHHLTGLRTFWINFLIDTGAPLNCSVMVTLCYVLSERGRYDCQGVSEEGLTGARKLTVERRTTWLRWLKARVRVRTMPYSGRDMDWRTPRTSISVRMVSPGRTGCAGRISSTPAPIMPPATVMD